MSRASRRVLGSASQNGHPRAALHHSPASSLASGSEQDFHDLQCPICFKSMVSLQNLNDHLDAYHNEVAEAVDEIGVRSWFQRQLKKGTKLAPVAAISKTLKLSEEFQRNGSSDSAMGGSQDTNEIVSRSHWQSETAHSKCSFPGCDPRTSNYRFRAINCRHCGKIFCERHTLYQMRLSRTANYEPVRGSWCRVCRPCYEGRPWYNDKEGTSRDLTLQFHSRRKQVVDRLQLEHNRLGKRLGVLLQAVAAEPPEARSLLSLFAANRGSQQSLIEQSVVPWEDESLETKCRICHRLYAYDNPKDHCRLCGKVVCADKARKCSVIEYFNDQEAIDKRNDSRIRLRLCIICTQTLFGGQDVRNDLSSKSAYALTYSNLQSYKMSIERLMSRFEGLLTTLNDEKHDRKTQLLEIRRIRQRLQDAFVQFEMTAKKVKHTPTEISSERKVQEAIYRSAVQFLQQHMVTLQSIPIFHGTKEAGQEREEESPEPVKDQTELHEELTTFTEQRVRFSLGSGKSTDRYTDKL